MFLFHQVDDGRVPGIEYLPCSAITPKVGMLLKVTSGKLAAATSTDVPLYMSMGEYEAALEAGTEIPVIRLHPDAIMEVATPTSFSQVMGAKVTIGSDSLSITNTTGGACEVIYTDADITRVRIVQPDAAAG